MRTRLQYRALKKDYPEKYGVFLGWLAEEIFKMGVLTALNDFPAQQRINIFYTFPEELQATIYATYWIEQTFDAKSKAGFLDHLPGNINVVLGILDKKFEKDHVVYENDLYDRSSFE
jgi:hypothetical protein